MVMPNGDQCEVELCYIYQGVAGFVGRLVVWLMVVSAGATRYHDDEGSLAARFGEFG